MSAKVSLFQIATVINKLLDGKLPLDEVAEIVAAYLVSERRTKELEGLMRKLLELRAQDGIYEAQASSAFELNELIRNQLEQIVKSSHDNVHRVVMHEQLDKSLLGGVRLETSDIQLDLSLQGKLQHLLQLTTNGA